MKDIKIKDRVILNMLFSIKYPYKYCENLLNIKSHIKDVTTEQKAISVAIRITAHVACIAVSKSISINAPYYFIVALT